MPPEKKDKKLLAEWFWTDRWDGSSATLLPIEQRGLYREMLTQAWRRGARLPNDHEAIRRACRVTSKEWKRCWPKVETYWRVDGRHLVNDTQLEIYAEAMAMWNAKSEASRKANEARWSKPPTGLPTDSDRTPNGLPAESPPSPSPSPETSKIKSSGAARRETAELADNEGTFALYRKIAHEALQKSIEFDGSEQIGNIAEYFKRFCAQRHLAYDADLAVRAIAAILDDARVSA